MDVSPGGEVGTVGGARGAAGAGAADVYGNLVYHRGGGGGGYYDADHVPGAPEYATPSEGYC
jgi:hypothetical protein